MPASCLQTSFQALNPLTQGLRLTGALDARAVPGAEAVLDGVAVDNAGWVLEPLPDDDGDIRRPPFLLLRFPPSITLPISSQGEK